MANTGFGSTIDRIVNSSLSDLLTKERQDEIRQIGKAWDFYYGFQEAYIKQYRGELKEDYDDKDKPTFNYTKAIVDEYVNGVMAKPVGFKFKSDDHQKVWDATTDPIRFFKLVPFFKKCQRIAEISNTCVVMIRYNKDTRLCYFEEIRGEFVHFLPKEDNPKEIGTLVIAYLFDTGIPEPTKRIMKRIEVWDQNKWELWLASPYAGEQKLLDSGPNPYGFIPAMRLMPDEDDNTFYGISKINDIVKVNEIYNNLWTSLIRICVMQSFSILVVKSDGEVNLTVAPTRFLKLENTAEAGGASYITPNPKIAEVEAVLMDLKSELQNVSHVPTEVIASARGMTTESGYALRIRRIPIEQEWESRRMSYGPSLRDLSRMTVAVDSINKGIQLRPEDVSVAVKFTDTVPVLAPQEQLLSDEQDLRYNLITPVDLLLRKYPGMSREEAKDVIKKNQEEMEALGFNNFGDDNETEFERLKIRMGQKEQKVNAEVGIPPKEKTE